MRRARMHARVGGRCVQRAREMCTTTIQILLLLLREQSAVNRLPRHNVSIQVRSGVLNRSAPLSLAIHEKSLAKESCQAAAAPSPMGHARPRYRASQQLVPQARDIAAFIRVSRKRGLRERSPVYPSIRTRRFSSSKLDGLCTEWAIN